MLFEGLCGGWEAIDTSWALGSVRPAGNIFLAIGGQWSERQRENDDDARWHRWCIRIGIDGAVIWQLPSCPCALANTPNDVAVSVVIGRRGTDLHYVLLLSIVPSWPLQSSMIHNCGPPKDFVQRRWSLPLSSVLNSRFGF